jgi:hypothetical protein
MLMGGLVRETWASARPTPTTRDHKGVTQNPEQMNYVPNIVAKWGSPRATPTKADGMGGPGNSGRDGGENLRTQAAATGQMPSTCLAQTESFVVRLTTLSAWLMGYTGAYLAHWATASSRRSRRKS